MAIGNMLPSFTIITPTYNAGEKLSASIESVLSQASAEFEYLLLDGASTDNTRKVAGSYRQDPRLRFSSESDEGIYHAMNKGIALARGRFLYFLGAGDVLYPGILSEMARLLPPPGISMIYGDVLWRNTGRVYDGRFTRRKLCAKNICHQAIFYENTIFRSLGNFDLAYKYCSDWAFNMKCFGDRRINRIYVDRLIAEYEGDGLSITHTDHAFNRDYQRLVRRHLGLSLYLRVQAKPFLARWRSRFHVPRRLLAFGKRSLPAKRS